MKSTCHVAGNKLVAIYSQQSECIRLEGSRPGNQRKRVLIVLGARTVLPSQQSRPAAKPGAVRLRMIDSRDITSFPPAPFHSRLLTHVWFSTEPVNLHCRYA